MSSLLICGMFVQINTPSLTANAIPVPQLFRDLATLTIDSFDVIYRKSPNKHLQNFPPRRTQERLSNLCRGNSRLVLRTVNGIPIAGVQIVVNSSRVSKSLSGGGRVAANEV